MSDSDLERINKAIRDTNFTNPDHLGNLNEMLGNYKEQLRREEAERVRDRRAAFEDDVRWSREREKELRRIQEKKERLKQSHGKFWAELYGWCKFIQDIFPLVLLGSIGLWLLSIGNWWIVRFFFSLLGFLFKVLEGILILFGL